MNAEPHEINGCFVIEVGERQAWPFLTFSDNRQAQSREARLYLDASWTVHTTGGRSLTSSIEQDNDVQRLGALLGLNNARVDQVHVSQDGALVIVFAGGAGLVAPGSPTNSTTHEPWWLSPWRL
jgi:hypothetical protein